MQMGFELRVLEPKDMEAVRAYGVKRLEEVVSDPVERELSSWTARWREEALKHYLALGWSFAATDPDGKILGIALAQPLLFFRGNTQSLWVEHFDFSDEAPGRALVEALYRWGRDKHIQAVIFEQGERAMGLGTAFPGKLNSSGWFEISTTRTKS